MSINVYLKQEIFEDEKLSQSPNFKNDYKFQGISLTRQNGRLFMKSKSLKEPIPEILVEFVEEISYHETLPTNPSRERGVYRLKSAEGELKFNDHEGLMYKLEILAKNLEDIQEVALKIKVGKIRPEESFEGEQQGVSRIELEKAVENLKKQNAALITAKKVLENKIGRVVRELTEAESTWKFWRVKDMILSTLTWLANEKVAEDENK